MKRLNYVVLATLAILTSFSLISCNKDKDDNQNQNPNSNKATVHIMLTDAPAVFDAVYVDIQELQLNSEAEGWVTVPLENPGIYNLLDFSNGLDTLLGTCQFPEGTLNQVRLILGDNNSVVVDSVEYPLTVPSGSTSGLKLNVHEVIQGGYTYTFWLDFDAAQSIHQTGNGKFMLRPVMRMYGETTSGSIEGYVLPQQALPQVTLYNAEDTLMALPDSTGYFRINGIPAGSYAVDFNSLLDSLPFQTQTLIDINIANGQTVQLDTIVLLP
ncbi:MAG: DUF4382 domain-containing protein [Chloroflexota bacterium]|jgi:hypothetical protein|nr:DUF4382 domain-containing protein [Lentimicrobium sp.]